jgi:hypothetical protein
LFAAVIATAGMAQVVPINLDNVTGNESECELAVTTSSPVTVINTVVSRATGNAFDFSWPSAGPGGFTGSLPAPTTEAPSKLLRWLWTTVDPLAAIEIIPTSCAGDLCLGKAGPDTLPQSVCSLACLNDAMSLTTTGVGDAFSLRWSGGTGPFTVYRSSNPRGVDSRENALPFNFPQSSPPTAGAPFVDATRPAPGVTFYYRVRGVSCVQRKSCSRAADCSVPGDGFCVTRGPFGAPGRSLYSNFVTVSSATLTTSVIRAFSPATPIFSATSTANAGGVRTTISNPSTSGNSIILQTEGVPRGCCPSDGKSGPQIRCGDACVEYRWDDENCGACGNRCADGYSCNWGVCELPCDYPQTYCEPACVDTSSDPNNCGSCGNVCGEGECCSNGECTELTCEWYEQMCDGQCFDFGDDEHCGSCDNVCGEGECCAYVEGYYCQSICGEGQEYCDGTCCEPSEYCKGGTCYPGDALTVPSSSGSNSATSLLQFVKTTGAFGTYCSTQLPPTDPYCPFDKVSAVPRFGGPPPGVVEAPECLVDPNTSDPIPPGGSITHCDSGAGVFREYQAAIRVCGDGVPGVDGDCGTGPTRVTTGTFNQLVRDRSINVFPAYVTPVGVRAVLDANGNDLLRTGRDGEPVHRCGQRRAHADHEHHRDARRPPRRSQLRQRRQPGRHRRGGADGADRLRDVRESRHDSSDDARRPIAMPAPPQIATNDAAFRVTVPANHPGNISRPMLLTVIGTVDGVAGRRFSVPFSLGIGGHCEYSAHARAYDALHGLQFPMAPLVRSGSPAPYPARTFSRHGSLELELGIQCGGADLPPEEIDAPEIVALTYFGPDEAPENPPLDIAVSTLVDAHGPRNSPLFTFNIDLDDDLYNWVYNLDAESSGLPSGRYVITIRIAGRDDYVTGFYLR